MRSGPFIVAVVAVGLALGLGWLARPSAGPELAPIVARAPARAATRGRAPTAVVLPRPAPAPRPVPLPSSGPVDFAALATEVETISTTPANAHSEQEWGGIADHLLDVADKVDELPSEDRTAGARVTFDLLVAAGRAAENGDAKVSPRYGVVGDEAVNVGYYRAARHLLRHPELSAEADLPDALGTYIQEITEGDLSDVTPDRIGPP